MSCAGRCSCLKPCIRAANHFKGLLDHTDTHDCGDRSCRWNATIRAARAYDASRVSGSLRFWWEEEEYFRERVIAMFVENP